MQRWTTERGTWKIQDITLTVGYCLIQNKNNTSCLILSIERLLPEEFLSNWPFSSVHSIIGQNLLERTSNCDRLRPRTAWIKSGLFSREKWWAIYYCVSCCDCNADWTISIPFSGSWCLLIFSHSRHSFALIFVRYSIACSNVQNVNLFLVSVSLAPTWMLSEHVVLHFERTHVCSWSTSSSSLCSSCSCCFIWQMILSSDTLLEKWFNLQMWYVLLPI